MALGIQAYPRTVLTEHQWEALTLANSELIDDVLDDLGRLEAGLPFAAVTITAYLPATYLLRYDAPFLRKFLVCLVSVGLKLQLPGVHPLGCTAEELAVVAMKARAEELLAADVDAAVADFRAWDEVVFEDTDHEWLYEPALDGIEDTAVGQALGPSHLRYDEWFTPFAPPRVMHPYATDDPLAS